MSEEISWKTKMKYRYILQREQAEVIQGQTRLKKNLMADGVSESCSGYLISLCKIVNTHRKPKKGGLTRLIAEG